MSGQNELELQGHPAATDAVEQVGLTEAEAVVRRERGQGNFAPDSPSRSLLEILNTNVFTYFNAIVLVSFLVLFALGRWQDAFFGIPALFNLLIGVVQEYRAKRTLDRLALLNEPTARVMRDGVERVIPREEVVLGDLLRLRSGDQVPADGRIVDHRSAGASALEVDESILTGESDAIRKLSGDVVLSGASVVGGAGYAIATRVGADSYAAKLTSEAKRFSLVHSELRSSIDRILRWVSWGLIPVALIVIYGQIASHGGLGAFSTFSLNHWEDAIVGAVAAMIAMVPMGLVLVTSIAFAASGVTLARQHVLIQELPAVEGLARVDTLCLDKTGTLTSGHMVYDGVHLFQARAGWQEVLGYIGRDPDANDTARCLAEPFGGPESERLEVVRTIPFDSAWKWSALVTASAGVAAGTWVLGAPEFVLADGQADALTAAAERSRAGLRTLVLAHSPVAVSGGQHPTLPSALAPVALLTFREELRSDARQTMHYFAEQGVEVRVISGDNPDTVATVARESGLEVAHGFDARELPEDAAELAQVLETERVFGRVTPVQKRTLVRALQAQGHVVAMTGDGVNDALALKEADLGIAMDTASQATKAVARIVLLDGRFDRLPQVVAEGRRVIANIERVSMLFLTKTTYAFGIATIFGLLAWAFPFLPRQLSITDGLTIGIPAPIRPFSSSVT